eukprot:1114348-Prymnesium_polylepis.2
MFGVQPAPRPLAARPQSPRVVKPLAGSQRAYPSAPRPGLGGGFSLRSPRAPVELEECVQLPAQPRVRTVFRGDPGSGVIVGDLYRGGPNDGQLRSDYVYNRAEQRLLPKGAGRAS